MTTINCEFLVLAKKQKLKIEVVREHDNMRLDTSFLKKEPEIVEWSIVSPELYSFLFPKSSPVEQNVMLIHV